MPWEPHWVEGNDGGKRHDDASRVRGERVEIRSQNPTEDGRILSNLSGKPLDFCWIFAPEAISISTRWNWGDFFSPNLSRRQFACIDCLLLPETGLVHYFCASALKNEGPFHLWFFGFQLPFFGIILCFLRISFRLPSTIPNPFPHLEKSPIFFFYFEGQIWWGLQPLCPEPQSKTSSFFGNSFHLQYLETNSL